ncbi:MAG TPA: cyclic nucleotide-binding domain-containing protein [Gemmataceae bacterium]|jgi:CRP-like cAMP-binding protein|nr:cyclic nucleotide-binding domain-containing protein [Gemmataceae bacterium]
MRKVFYLLGDVNDSDIEWLMANSQRERFAAGAVLVREGEPIQALYIVLAGALEACFAGRPSLRLETGDIVGELSFIDDHAPSPRVTAAEDTVVLAIDRQRLLARLKIDNDFSVRFYNSIAVFLVQRLPEASRRPGAGKDEDELNLSQLNTIHTAARRFHRVLQRLLAE